MVFTASATFKSVTYGLITSMADRARESGARVRDGTQRLRVAGPAGDGVYVPPSRVAHLRRVNRHVRHLQCRPVAKQPGSRENASNAGISMVSVTSTLGAAACALRHTGSKCPRTHRLAPCSAGDA
jgi:hypothetical protein